MQVDRNTGFGPGNSHVEEVLLHAFQSLKEDAPIRQKGQEETQEDRGHHNLFSSDLLFLKGYNSIKEEKSRQNTKLFSLSIFFSPPHLYIILGSHNQVISKPCISPPNEVFPRA